MFRYLPAMLTIGNALSGVMAVIQVLGGNYHIAAAYIVLGALFDSVDGYSARKLAVSSEFGKELDSLADTITFGVAPSLLVFSMSAQGILEYVAFALFVVCAIVRLARFNVLQSQLSYFVGMPVPMAALLLLLASFNLPSGLSQAIMIGLSYLMISNIRIPNFKKIKVPAESEQEQEKVS